MSDGYNTSNNSNAQPGQVLSWNGNSGGWQTITIPSGNGNVFVPGQIVYTITVGGGGGGGSSITQAPISGDVGPETEKKKNDKGGCSCKKCKDFFEYAEPNQKDGTLICWSCRHGY